MLHSTLHFLKDDFAAVNESEEGVNFDAFLPQSAYGCQQVFVLLLAKFFGCKFRVAVFVVSAIVVGYENDPLNFVGFNQQVKAFNEGQFGLRDESRSASDYKQIAPFHVQTSPQKLQSGSDEPLIAAENSQVAAEFVFPRCPTAKLLQIHFSAFTPFKA
jgi:hypothetical protein